MASYAVFSIEVNAKEKEISLAVEGSVPYAKDEQRRQPN